MSTTDKEIVIGATLKTITVPVLDSNGDPRDLTGGSVRLQGVSPDIVTTIDEVGTIVDGPGGIAKWYEAGDLLALGDLGGKPRATFVFRVEFVDASAKKDWTPEFDAYFVPPPAV